MSNEGHAWSRTLTSSSYAGQSPSSPATGAAAEADMTVRCDASVESSRRLDLCAMPRRESAKASDDAVRGENQRAAVDRTAFEKRMLSETGLCVLPLRPAREGPS